MKSSTVVTFVIVVLLLQVVSTALLWIVNVLSTQSSSVFAILLAADILAFVAVVQVYRDPRSSESTTANALPASSLPPPQNASPPAQAPTSPPKQSAPTGTQQPLTESPAYAALPRIIHIGIPIASFLVILVFAIVVFLPADRIPIPAESTLLFVPIYLLIVVTLVFGSMYLFKRLVDAEDSPPSSPGSATTG